jgi:hypothetical protein
MRAEGQLDHTPWVEVREAALGRVAACDLRELGRHEAGCDRGDAHAGDAQLLSERLRELSTKALLAA